MLSFVPLQVADNKEKKQVAAPPDSKWVAMSSMTRGLVGKEPAKDTREKSEKRKSAKSELVVVDNVLPHQCPTPDKEHPRHPNNQLTKGDLHGDAINLIDFLIRQNVLELKNGDADFRRLETLYEESLRNRTVSSWQATIAEFNRILSEATFHTNAGLVRLIGDELCDRGNNDYFTLKILQQLFIRGVPYEILFSNHGYSFLRNFERYICQDDPSIREDIYTSFENLLTLIIAGVVSRSEMADIVNTCYKPRIKAISYSVDGESNPPKVSIYTHAPVGFEVIEAFADLYDVDFLDDTIDSLCKTIDKINNRFAHDLKSKHIHKLYDAECMASKQPPLNAIPANTYVSSKLMVSRLIWNRGTTDPELNAINVPAYRNGYQCMFVHGHDGYGLPMKSDLTHMVSLDNLYRRDIKSTVEEHVKMTRRYHILYSQEKSGPMPVVTELSQGGKHLSLKELNEAAQYYTMPMMGHRFFSRFFPTNNDINIVALLERASCPSERYQLALNYLEMAVPSAFTQVLAEVMGLEPEEILRFTPQELLDSAAPAPR